MPNVRNKPCWCRSGKKYKYCHLNRDEQQKITISEGVAALRRIPDSAECNCPPSEKRFCSDRLIGSHSIAKCLGLREFSENGHVYALKYDFQTLKKTGGSAEIGRESINKISVFPGFCSYHDSELFKPVEGRSFDKSPEQCALLSYRAIARERYSKLAGFDVNNFLKAADKGRSVNDQIEIQTLLHHYGSGLMAATIDLDNAICEHQSALISKDYSRFCSLILQFEDFPILSSTGHMPSEDWSGNQIQDLSNVKMPADWITCISFKSGGSSWIIFTWLKSSARMASYVASLMSSNFIKSDALAKYLFTISENIVVDGPWWQSLSAVQRQALMARVKDGLPIGGGINIIAPREGEPVVADFAFLNSFEV